MKKLVAVAVCGVALMGTLGLSGRVDAQQPGSEGVEPTDAEFEAAVDARHKELLGILLEAGRKEARTAALHR